MRLYRWLLRLCPAALRREYGAAMEETFARRMADARTAGLWPRLRVLARESIGIVVLALSERWGAGARARRRRRRWNGDVRRKARPMNGLGREIRQAARRLRRAPSFTLTAMMTLALAIGANAAIFAVVQRVVLNPLPYPDSDRLIVLDHGARGLNMAAGIPVAPGLYYQYADRARTLESVALYRTEELTLTGIGDPARIHASRVTTSLASVLRVSPVRGRWFSEAEGAPGAAPVALLSHGFWMRRYGGDPGIVGQAVRLDGVATEIVGVMPPSYAFPDPYVDVWRPEQIKRPMAFGIFGYFGVARLREGVTLAAARTDLDAAIADLPRVYPDYAAGVGYNLHLTSSAITLKESIVGRVARALWILLASVGLVLLVACANVANLFLIRSEARQREVAVRLALGAGGRGIARYFLTESLLLSIAGGALGLALAWGAVRLLVDFGPANLPRLTEVRLDGASLAFTGALALVVALLFGAIPLLRGGALAVSLHEGGRGNTASRGRHRARRLLMAGQISLALVLLVSSGLMVRSFQKLRAIDPGFNASSALTFRLGLPSREYPDRRTGVAAHHAVIDQLSALPGVTAVSASTCLPLTEEGLCYGNALFVQGRPLPAGSLPPMVAFRAVAGGYVETMGIRLLRGRAIERDDVERGEPIVVISEALANVYFPNEDAIGRRVASSSPHPVWMTIVGIVANTPMAALAEANSTPVLYLPMSITSGPGIPDSALLGPDMTEMSYVVRSATPPAALAPSVRRAVSAVNTNLAVVQVRTLQDIMDAASAQMAFTMVLLAIAASVALMLGAIGIYGAMSYIVSQRTAEIGVRLALGAEPGSVARMVVLQGGLVALVGLVVGLAAALASGTLIESLLYDVSAHDPIVFTGTSFALLLVSVFACWLPARRAARMNPVTALRAD
jgi:predicted permease